MGGSSLNTHPHFLPEVLPVVESRTVVNQAKSQETSGQMWLGEELSVVV